MQKIDGTYGISMEMSILVFPMNLINKKKLTKKACVVRSNINV